MKNTQEARPLFSSIRYSWFFQYSNRSIYVVCSKNVARCPQGSHFRCAALFGILQLCCSSHRIRLKIGKNVCKAQRYFRNSSSQLFTRSKQRHHRHIKCRKGRTKTPCRRMLLLRQIVLSCRSPSICQRQNNEPLAGTAH